MNIVNRLTLRHIKENKGRAVVTTMGIIVSVAMITAVFVAVASFMNLFGEIELISSGRNVASFAITSQDQLEKLRADERIDDIGIAASLDYSSYKLEKGKYDYLTTGDILSGDTVYLNQMVTGDYDGVLPKNENEIAVEENLIKKNELDWKIGDTVYIPLGSRVLEQDGEQFVMGGSYTPGEEFQVGNIGEYKITAILHNNPSTFNCSYGVLRGYDSENISPDTDTPIDVYVNLKKYDYHSLNELKDIVKEYNISNYNFNNIFLDTKFSFDELNPTVVSLVSIAAVFIVIIIIVSIVLIYNAFAMSISERVRYLGMLASVGATKKQKKQSVYFESFILGIIGIPVGFAAGVLGIGITLKLIGKKIIETGMIVGMNESNIEMPVVVPIYVVLGILLVSVLTIFVSSVIPSRKASKITPIDAIRQTNEIKVKAKRLRSSKFVRLIFGYEGELANKNLKRNGRKARIITISIAMSMILFLSCNYFCSMFTRSVDIEADMPCQVSTMLNSPSFDKREQQVERITQIDGVDDCFCITNIYYVYENSDCKLLKPEYYTPTYSGVFSDGANVYFNVLDDEDFDKLCKDNKLDSKPYYDDYKLALVMNNISHSRGGSDVFSDNFIGFDDFGNDITVGAFVKYDPDNYACNLNPKESVSLFMPLSSYIVYEQENVEDPQDAVILYQIGIKTDKHAAVCEALYELRNLGEIDIAYVNDYVDNIKTMAAVAFIIQLLVYGFITLITLITVFNIINTISTGIIMRKKEFAMLKSVGTTPEGFRKMILLESAFYGIKAVIFALPISAAVSFVMNFAMRSSSIPFEINWMLYLIATVVVFVIIGFTMLYSVNKLKDDSIVETLKEEIN